MKLRTCIYILIILILQSVKSNISIGIKNPHIEVILNQGEKLEYTKISKENLKEQGIIQINSTYIDTMIENRAVEKVEVIGTDYTYNNYEELDIIYGNFLQS